MNRWTITPWQDQELEPVLKLWEKAFADRVYDFRIDQAGFRQKILNNPSFDPDGALVAKVNEETVGFVLAAAPKDGDVGFLSVLMVDPAYRGEGIGGALLEQAEAFLVQCGKKEIRVNYRGNPMSFATGGDVTTPGYYFLLNHGFRNRGSLSLFMELMLADFEWREEVSGVIEESTGRGIHFGMCGEEHREALCRFMEKVFPGGWEASIKGALAEGRPVFVATEGDRVVGFSGPVRVQEGGAGGFTGIGTDPEFRRRKIGMVLFHLMCAEFKKRGARYSTLHTGIHNPAQEIYFGAGYRVRCLVDYDLVKKIL